MRKSCLLVVLVAALAQPTLGQDMRPVLPLDADSRLIYQQDAARLVREARGRKLPLPKRGNDLVASEQTAVQIHIAIASAVFGKEHIDKQRPFFALREGPFWVVYGSLPVSHLGGTAVTVIRAANGEVVGVVHQQ